jgi:predicted nucleotidyltransferase
VILFGSAAGQDAWHERSDIDLAVEGLAPEQFFTAYAACHDMLPRGLELDLVPLERVYPEMRARILGEASMPDHPVLAIQALVEDEMTALERVTQEMADLLAERADPPTRTELRAIAGILHEFYNGVERILQHIAVGLGEGVPPLKEYLEFRHFFRHAYGYTLAWDQLRWKAESLPDTLNRLGEQLHAFFESLTGPRSTGGST